MNVLKIVVDKLPEKCVYCDIPFLLCKAMTDNESVSNQILLDMATRPTWCPLVVEVQEVCEWKHNKHEGDNDFQIPQYDNKHGVSWWDSVKHQFVFCPHCGKPIKYIESE